MVINYSVKIKSALPLIRLYILNFQSTVDVSSPILWEIIEKYIFVYRNNISLENVNKIAAIKAARNSYKKCGKDPNRYRPSADSLIRRIVKGNGLYKVNNVVDVLNFISVQSGISIGGYDTDKIMGKVIMDIGTFADIYTGIGRGELNIEGLPVLRDNVGVFGSPTSDSERTMITTDTKNCAFVFFDFGVSEELQNYVYSSITYLKEFANSSNILENIIKN